MIGTSSIRPRVNIPTVLFTGAPGACVTSSAVVPLGSNGVERNAQRIHAITASNSIVIKPSHTRCKSLEFRKGEYNRRTEIKSDMRTKPWIRISRSPLMTTNIDVSATKSIASVFYATYIVARFSLADTQISY